MSDRDRLSDHEVRALGYEPTWKGWIPVSDEAKGAIAEAEERLAEARQRPRWRSFVIEGRPQPCIVCGQPAEPSLVGTPTCSEECLGRLADYRFSRAYFTDPLHTRADGSGGTEQIRPRLKPKRVRPVRDTASLDAALHRVGTPREVLERHGVRIRGGWRSVPSTGTSAPRRCRCTSAPARSGRTVTPAGSTVMPSTWRRRSAAKT